jgi:ribonuclease P/MRP protein subunit RPP40
MDPSLEWCPPRKCTRPHSFLIYINNIDDVIDSKILKFADDTKLYRRIASEEDAIKLQEDLALLCEWFRNG